jgi:hypothetical protein
MKFNRPYVMVALVGSDEDALMDNANQSADWKTVTRKFKKGNAKTRVKVSNLRINENAMRVFIKTAAKNDEPKSKPVNAPHKPRKVEAFKNKAHSKPKKALKDQTSKKFPNSKFQKILDLGMAEMKKYDRSFNGSNVVESTKKLKQDYLKTLKNLENQLKVYKLLLQFKISRIPKYFRPYAELHFKRAVQDELPDSIRSCPRHMFNVFHRLGDQTRYVKKYRTILRAMLQNMEFHMGELEEEQLRYKDSSDYFYEFMYDEETNTYFKPEKTQKNQKKTKSQKKNVVTNPYLLVNTQMILSISFITMIYFLHVGTMR